MSVDPPRRGRIRLGTQGWNYDAWVGPLYPSGTRSAEFLRLYARAFDTVEVDSTFYAIPTSKTVRGWADRAPPDFRFALKMPREVTHERRLLGAKDVVDEFCDRARELGDRLGPILVQLGPNFGPSEYGSLAEFLPRLPSDLRFAVEFRQPGWLRRDVFELLRTLRICWACSDGRWIPRPRVLKLARRPTSSFLYLRWMGPNRDLTDYSRVQIDRSAELEEWAEAVRAPVEEGVEIFGYVNNHYSGHSPATVRELQRLLGMRTVEPGEIADQTSLF